MSQPCSAVELVLFDADGLSDSSIRATIQSVIEFGVLTGAVLNAQQVARVVEAAGQSDRLGFWLGGTDSWPFERAIAFANVEPGRVLFVSNNPVARDAALSAGVRLYDESSGDIASLLP